MFAGQEEPGPVSSIVDSGYRPGDDDGDESDFEDMEEPEPIPQVFTEPDSDDEFEDEFEDDEIEVSSGRKRAIIALMLVLLLLGGVGAGLFFAKDAIVTAVPQLKPFYEAVENFKFTSEELGDGLELRDISAQNAIGAGGVDLLVVSFKIVNVVDVPRPVPAVRVSLLDEEGAELQAVVVEPEVHEVPAGEERSAVGNLENPSALGRRLSVGFVPRGGEAGGGAAREGNGETPH